jgi:hypothetical protein
MESVVLYFVALLNLVIENAPYLVGFILPPFIEILNREVPSKIGRHTVSLLVCLVVAIVLHWHKIESGSPEQVAAIAGVIFTESNTVYKYYFENSWNREVLREKLGSVDKEDQVSLETPLGNG